MATSKYQVKQAAKFSTSTRIKRLAQRPDISRAVRQIRADMAEADRAYAEREESSAYKREQFTERVPSTLPPGILAVCEGRWR